MLLIGKQAPSFVTSAVVKGNIVDNFSLEQYLGHKYVLLFFYPADFSGLCPTEILAFEERLKEFEELDVQIVGCSTDSKFVHQKWLTVPVHEGGIMGVSYPLVADKSMTISQNYDVLAGEYTQTEDGYLEFDGFPMDYRATFLIDKHGKIRHQSVNEFAMGRDVEEFLRLVEGIRLIDETGGACPANWKRNKK